MALSVSIFFFIAVAVPVSLWMKEQYQQERISKRRTDLLIQAFRSMRA